VHVHVESTRLYNLRQSKRGHYTPETSQKRGYKGAQVTYDQENLQPYGISIHSFRKGNIKVRGVAYL
jgi:hypothetical protein